MPGIEVISTLFFSIFQIGFGGWQFMRKTAPYDSTNRLRYLILTVSFLAFNLVSLLNTQSVPYVRDALGIVLGAYFFYFLVLRLLPVESGKLKRVVAIASLIISSFFLAVLSPISTANSQWGLVTFVPILLSFYLLIATMISFMGKYSQSETTHKRISEIFKQLIIVIVLSGSLLIDTLKPGFQLTVNMVFILVAFEFILNIQGFSFNSLHVPIGTDVSENENAQKLNHSISFSLDFEEEEFPQFGFTKSETLVARLLMKGYSVQQMADELKTSKDSVYQCTSKIYRKSNTQTPQEFILKVLLSSAESQGFQENSDS